MSTILTIKGENIPKYFSVNKHNLKRKYCLVPTNENIFKYYKFIKKYYNPHNGSDLGHLIKRFNSFEDYSRFNTDNDSTFLPQDVIVFEFPDNYPEDDLFYFKMKYC